MATALMSRKKSEFAPGEHPHSQDNLSPRSPMYEESKKRRVVMVTDSGWDGFKALAKSMGFSASELVERLGRGLVEIDRDRGKPGATDGQTKNS